MNYIELYIPARDSMQSEIFMAELAGFPFESFEQEATCLKAYIRKEELAACRAEVDEFLLTTGVECRYTEIAQQNWNALWESGFEPVNVGGRCVIRAPFHDEPADDVLDIVIMPKMSFGTGHHATTWLMTAAIMDADLRGLSGLDMGSGTGVLSIVAAKRGAAHLDAVDIDGWAYENCMENIEVNDVAGSVTPILGDVSAISGRSYDFILANINRNILLADMESYRAVLSDGGAVIMSGILEKDIPAISEKAASLGLTVCSTRTKEGWAVVICRWRRPA